MNKGIYTNRGSDALFNCSVKTIDIRHGNVTVVQAIGGGVHRTKQPVDCNANGNNTKVYLRGLKNTKVGDPSDFSAAKNRLWKILIYSCIGALILLVLRVIEMNCKRGYNHHGNKIRTFKTKTTRGLGKRSKLLLLLLCRADLGVVGLDPCSVTNGATINTGGDCQCGTSVCTSSTGTMFCQTNTCHTSAFGSAALPNGDSSLWDPGTGLRKVVSHWIGGGDLKKTVMTTYGSIEDWQVSGVTNMRNVFYNKQTFNADLSKWNVAAVTNMRASTYNSTSFLSFLFIQ